MFIHPRLFATLNDSTRLERCNNTLSSMARVQPPEPGRPMDTRANRLTMRRQSLCPSLWLMGKV